MRRAKTLLWVLLALPAIGIGIWFTQDNSAPVSPVLFGFPLTQLPLGIWLILAFMAGVLISVLATVPSLAVARARQRRLEREVARLNGVKGGD
jgi:uncharacterized integral membrane protein